MMKMYKYSGIGIPDKYFFREDVPMTKSEVRAVTMSKLELAKEDIMLDIGSGTGSVTVEGAFICKKVYAVETKKEAIALTKKNLNHFNIKNSELINGLFPNVDIPVDIVDAIFIGGSKGKLKEIFKWANKNLNAGGRIVANFVTLENTVEFIDLLKEYKYEDIDITHMQISKGKNIASYTMMQSNNPIYIIKGVKKQ